MSEINMAQEQYSDIPEMDMTWAEDRNPEERNYEQEQAVQAMYDKTEALITAYVGGKASVINKDKSKKTDYIVTFYIVNSGIITRLNTAIINVDDNKLIETEESYVLSTPDKFLLIDKDSRNKILIENGYKLPEVDENDKAADLRFNIYK